MFATMARAVSKSVAVFDQLTQVTPIIAVWADDPLWTTGKPADGGAVSEWRSTSGQNPAQGSSSFQPIYHAASASFNNHATVEFEKVNNDRLIVDCNDQALPFKAVAVYRHTSLENTTNPFGWGSSSGGFTMNGSNTFAVSLGTVVGSAVSRDTVAHVARAKLDVSGSGGCDMWLDETQIITAGGAGTNGFSWFKLGCSGAAGTHGRFSNCEVAFAAIYASATSDVDLAALCDDLQTYYGTP
jgi:hypothetical protein